LSPTITIGHTAKFGKVGISIALYCREPMTENVNAFERVIVICGKVIVEAKKLRFLPKLILILN
jgi:hypothetical protein